MVNRTEVLGAAKEVFLQAYLAGFDRCLPTMMAIALKKSESSAVLSQRNDYHVLRDLLRDRSNALRQNLHNSMEKLLQRSLQTAYSSFRPAFALAEQSSLSLIEPSAFEGELRLTAFTERFRNEAEDQLRDLNGRIASLFDQEEVKEREVPFRPYLVSKSLEEGADGMHLSQTLTEMLMHLLADGYAQAVTDMYASVNSYFLENGLAADLPLRIRKTPYKALAAERLRENVMSRFETGAADGSGFANLGGYFRTAGGSPMMTAGANVVPSAEYFLTFDQLCERASLFSETAAEQRHAGNVAVSATRVPSSQPNGGAQPLLQETSVAAALDTALDDIQPEWLRATLQAAMGLRNILQRGRPAANHGSLTPALAQALNTALREAAAATLEASVEDARYSILAQRRRFMAQTDNKREQTTIDIVAMLFEFIVRDRQLSPAIRAQLGKLQFPMLKLALHDDNFWLQATHPARLLLNRVASLSFSLQANVPASNAIQTKIVDITDAVVTAASAETEFLPDLFTQLHDELFAFVEQDFQGKDEKLHRAVRAIQDIPARSQALASILLGMKRIVSGLNLEIFLRDFLVDIWPEVIAEADNLRLAGAERFRVLVPNLIWSIAPKQDEYDRQTLSALLPVLIKTLREGLILIAWPQNRQKEFLGRLFEAHTGALRATQPLSSVVTLAGLHAAFEPLLKHLSPELPISKPALRDADTVLLNGVVRRLDADIQLASDCPHLMESRPGRPLAAASANSEQYQLRLHSGILIGIGPVGERSTARLSWAGPEAATMLFRLEAQAALLLLTLDQFQDRTARGQLVWMEERLLFDRAVQSLLQTAEYLERIGLAA